MIAGIYHQGSGLGNQLFRYITTRCLATDKGYEWGMLVNNNDPSKVRNFKGSSFMGGDFYGLNPIAQGWPGKFTFWGEKKTTENGVDIRGYDPDINFVRDFTVIDGEFQDARYWEHRLPDIGLWLEVEPYRVADDTCVIGFRGGEYASIPDLFLSKEYWEKAISMFPGFNFEVHTDDPTTAKQFFPDYPIVHNIGLNWRTMRYAKYAIIANSSFYILPRILSGGTTIAPRYWARRNIGVWSLPQNYYEEFTYV